MNSFCYGSVLPNRRRSCHNLRSVYHTNPILCWIPRSFRISDIGTAEQGSGKQWEFDGVSVSAKVGIVIAFAVTTTVKSGSGNLRVSLDILYETVEMYS